MFNVNTKSKSIQMKNTKSVFPLKDFIFISLDTKICRKSSGPVWSLSSWMTSASDWHLFHKSSRTRWQKKEKQTDTSSLARHCHVHLCSCCLQTCWVWMLPEPQGQTDGGSVQTAHTLTHTRTHTRCTGVFNYSGVDKTQSVTFPCEREGFSVSRLPRGRKPLHILTIQAELPVGGSSSGALWADAKKKPPAILQHDIFRCRTETSLQDLTDFTIRLKHSSALTLQVFFLCIVFIIKSPK